MLFTTRIESLLANCPFLLLTKISYFDILRLKQRNCYSRSFVLKEETEHLRRYIFFFQKFMAVNGYFTANLTQLEIPASLRAGQCPYEPAVQVEKTYNFGATVKPLDQRLPVGHIRDDRLIWFSDAKRHLEI